MYQRIMIPVDGSATAECGLKEALSLVGTGGRVCLLHVVDAYPLMVDPPAVFDYDALERQLCDSGRKVLERARKMAEESGARADTLLREVTHGRVADVIVDEARKAGCDLIVMGTHGRRGFKRWAIGSDAESVVRHSPLPVLLVRHPEGASS